MPHSPTCRGCAALQARTQRWRDVGHLTDADLAIPEHTLTAPDPYAAAITQLRAGLTKLSNFEAKYKAERAAAFRAEAARRAQHFAAQPSPRLTAAELADYAPPDIYGLKKKEH